MSRSRPLASAAVLAASALVLTACTGTAASPSATVEPAASATPMAHGSAGHEASPTPEASESEAAAAEAEVTIERSQFEPMELTVAAGTVVTFTNPETFPHTVTEGSGGRAVDDPIVNEELEAGGSIEVKFDEPGTYEITCRFHPSMQMTLTVEG